MLMILALAGVTTGMTTIGGKLSKVPNNPQETNNSKNGKETVYKDVFGKVITEAEFCKEFQNGKFDMTTDELMRLTRGWGEPDYDVK